MTLLAKVSAIMRDFIDLKPRNEATPAAAAEPASSPLPAAITAAPETAIPPDAEPEAANPESADHIARITADVIKGLKTVYDPEIPVDIYELGLIYKVDLSDDGQLAIDMTLTAPGCPVAGEMPGWVENAVKNIDGVAGVKVSMVFEPPWTPERMSDEARLELGWM